MEVRSLAQCLRARPASSLLASKQPSILRGQSFSRATSVRYSSTQNPSQPPSGNSNDSNSNSNSNSNKNKNNTTPQSTTDPKTAPSTKQPNKQTSVPEYDSILDNLNFQSSSQAANRDPFATQSTQRTFFDRNKYRAQSEAAAKRAASATMSEVSSMERPTKPPRMEFKLGPELGRQVLVEPERGMDLNNALKQMNINLSTNRVRSQKTAQKFHIRRGQMRKNLKMQRWRKLFKFSFAQTVAKVQRMRAQGW